MATRLKTVEYWFPHLTTLVDAADTNLTQITVYLPESSKTFVSVFAEAVVHDRNTTIGNITRRQVSLQLGSAGYDVVNNTTTMTNGGEQQTVMFSGDFTATFTADWSGTSMTCDCRLLLDTSAGSPLNPSFSNASVRLVITYEYDDTTTTHVKTVRIPLDMPVGAQGTSQPSSLATIPALDTELPEASKTIRQLTLVLQGNDNGSSTDLTFNMKVGSETTFTSQAYEHASNVAMFIRLNHVQTWDTSTTQSWYAWCSSAVGHHMQAWLVVTYEFDSTSANDVFVSLLLAMQVDSPMGGVVSGDYQRATRELMVQESGLVQKQSAFYVFYDTLAAIAGLNMRIGTGSFVAYTDAAAVLAGSQAAMVRNDSAYTLARGRNTLNFDVYRTDTTDLGYNVGGFWIVNYTCDKPADGHGAENHTIERAVMTTSNTAAAVSQTSAATAGVVPPESAYYITSIGAMVKAVPSGTAILTGVGFQCERLASGEGGIAWEQLCADVGGTDGETGIYHSFCQMRSQFKRWPGDPGADRMDIESSRRWRIAGSSGITTMFHVSLLMTYHSILFAVADSISGFSGTVNLALHRAASGEKVLETTRSGDGAFSFDWYDDTEELFVSADDGTNVGRSTADVAV